MQAPTDQELMIRVKDATVDPDGQRREYFIRVPPDTKTCPNAIAWTFDMSPEEYAKVERES